MSWINKGKNEMANGDNGQRKIPAAPLARRPLHQHAADVAQSIIDLESDLKLSQEDAERWMHRAAAIEVDKNHFQSLLDQEREQFSQALRKITAEKDYYQRRTTSLVAKLRASAGIILEAINEQDSPYQNGPSTNQQEELNKHDLVGKHAEETEVEMQAKRAIEDALAVDHSGKEIPPLPKFLQQGPMIPTTNLD